jgi:hypothetical protein
MIRSSTVPPVSPNRMAFGAGFSWGATLLRG